MFEETFLLDLVRRGLGHDLGVQVIGVSEIIVEKDAVASELGFRHHYHGRLSRDPKNESTKGHRRLGQDPLHLGVHHGEVSIRLGVEKRLVQHLDRLVQESAHEAETPVEQFSEFIQSIADLKIIIIP